MYGLPLSYFIFLILKNTQVKDFCLIGKIFVPFRIFKGEDIMLSFIHHENEMPVMHGPDSDGTVSE